MNFCLFTFDGYLFILVHYMLLAKIYIHILISYWSNVITHLCPEQIMIFELIGL